MFYFKRSGENTLSGSNEYLTRGEYHKYLDPNWNYYPIYVRKIVYLEEVLDKYDKSCKILDAGCGEGVLVEKFNELGYDIVGIDLNYSSNLVRQGNVLEMDFGDDTFDIVLLLDVIEHVNYQEQEKVLTEIKRVLKRGGVLIASIPNLAHKASRWEFFKNGMLIRTANILKHPGDRPIKEYIELILKNGYSIIERHPIKLTLPRFQEKILKTLMGNKRFESYIFSEKRNPDDCFLNIFLLRNDK